MPLSVSLRFYHPLYFVVTVNSIMRRGVSEMSSDKPRAMSQVSAATRTISWGPTPVFRQFFRNTLPLHASILYSSYSSPKGVAININSVHDRSNSALDSKVQGIRGKVAYVRKYRKIG